MCHLRGKYLWAISATVLILPGRSVAAEDSLPSQLAFSRTANELRFDTGVLKGTLAEGGKPLGLRPVTHIASNVQIAGMFGILSPYRLLTSTKRFGTAAWDWVSTTELLPDGGARVRWKADKEHPLDMTGVYRWSANNTLDLKLTVKPQRDLRKFEVFLASYFNGFSTSLAYVKQDGSANVSGQFIEALKTAGDWQTFPRDAAAATIYGDGRWSLPPNPVAWRIMPCYFAPIAIRRDSKSGLTAVLMSRPSDCFAVSMPYGEEGHRSVYFSLFGVDLNAGHESSAHVRLVIDKDIGDEKAKKLYRAFLEN